MAIARSPVFNLMHHPEAYIQSEGMPGFEEIIGELKVETKQVRADVRRGFKWDWSGPLSFNVELPEDPVFAFEWGFDPYAYRFGRDFKLTVTISQGGNEVTVADISGRISPSEDESIWQLEKVALLDFKPGAAKVTFEFEGLADKLAEENFLIANPRIYSTKLKKKHVILIAVDTLRADHLSCYGYERDTSTNIDRWAKNGKRYEYCISTSPWTFPSFASMLTGRYPSVCGGTTNIRYLPGEETTLAEVLSREGFTTRSIVNLGWVGPPVNLHQGFDGAVQLPTGRCEGTFARAKEWLEAHSDEDTFLFLHFMDPHQPYNPPREYNTMYDPGYSGRYDTSFGGDVVENIRAGEMRLDGNELEHVIALYDGEIKYFDTQFGDFLTTLDEMGLTDDSIVILTADHGEEFFEHGAFEHGHCLYDEVLRVPLIIGGLGYSSGVDDRVASTIDIFPTILDFFDIHIPNDINGFSLLEQPTEKDRLLVSEQLLYGEELKGLTTSEYRYIYHTVSGDEELYDLHDDITMLKSIAADRRATARSFRGFLTSYVVGKGTPWHLFFMREVGGAKVYSYSGTVTCPGGFAEMENLRFDGSDSFSVTGETIRFKLRLEPSSEKEIRFITNDEAAEIHFELMRNGEPMEGDIFIGPELDEAAYPEFSLNISDERFGLGQPNLRRKIHDGVFIWAIPTRLREQFQPDLTPEMEAELRSIGYLN